MSERGPVTSSSGIGVTQLVSDRSGTAGLTTSSTSELANGPTSARIWAAGSTAGSDWEVAGVRPAAALASSEMAPSSRSMTEIFAAISVGADSRMLDRISTAGATWSAIRKPVAACIPVSRREGIAFQAAWYVLAAVSYCCFSQKMLASRT